MPFAVHSDGGLSRVSVYAGPDHVDVVLPAEVPVGVLLPSITDILEAASACTGEGPGIADSPIDGPYRLSRPGFPPLDTSESFAQQGICDGTVLMLTASPAAPPAPRLEDPAEAVSTAANSIARQWTPQAARLTAALAAGWPAGLGAVALVRSTTSAEGGRNAGIAAAIACAALFTALLARRVHGDTVLALTLCVLSSGFAAVAGFAAVPGDPGAPKVLLAAMAAAVTAVVAMRVTNCGAVTLTSISGIALLAAAAALAALVFRAPLHVVGSMLAAVSVGLLSASGRLSLVLARLRPRVPATGESVDLDSCDDAGDQTSLDILRAKAIRAHDWLTILVVSSSASAALGAVVTVTGLFAADRPRLAGALLTVVVTVVALLRSRSHADRTRRIALIISGTLTVSALLAAVVINTPWHSTWVAAVAVALAATALGAGFIAPAITFSPITRRGVELAEHLAIAAVIPLTCWVCGLYGAARDLSLT